MQCLCVQPRHHHHHASSTPCAPRRNGRRSAVRRSKQRVRSAATTGASAAACTTTNPIGVHALVFAGDWTEASARKAAAGAAAAGYGLLEIAAFNAETLDTAMTRSVFEEHGLRPSCSLGLTLDADVSSDSQEVVARGAAQLNAALDFAAASGAQHLCGVLYSALAKYPGPPTAAGRANCVRELRKLATKAEDKGVRVSLEVVNRYETNVLNTAAQAMELLAEVNHSNLYVHLDSYHMHIEESGLEAAVQLCGERLGYVHIGESHRGYLGSGSIDFPALFRGLAHIRYTGPITFESFSSAVVSRDLSDNLCVWRNMWSDSGDLAAHARSYIQQQWVAAHIAARQATSSTPGI